MSDFPPAPPDSMIRLQESDDGLKLVAAPLGLWRGSYVGCVLGPGLLLWMVVMLVRLGPAASEGINLVLISVLGGFGFLLTLVSFDLGKAVSRIELDDEHLTAVRSGFLGSRKRKVPRASITSVGLAEAWFTLGNQKVYNLTITTSEPNAKPIKRLTNYPERDQRWCAAVLAQALGMTPTSDTH